MIERQVTRGRHPVGRAALDEASTSRDRRARGLFGSAVGFGALAVLTFFLGQDVNAGEKLTIAELVVWAVTSCLWLVLMLVGLAARVKRRRWVGGASGAACGISFATGPLIVYTALSFGVVAAVSAIAVVVVATSETLHRRWRGVHAMQAAVASGALAAAAFFAVPTSSAQYVLVAICAGLGALWLAGLLGAAVWDLAHRRRRAAVLVPAALALVVEVAGTAVLNAYADNRLTSSAAVVQAAYADVAEAVEIGNGIAAGHDPSGATFSLVSRQAAAAQSLLDSMGVPGDLADYEAEVATWAGGVAAAGAVAERGGGWHVATTPAPFVLSMTLGQARAALDASIRRVATAIEFGNQAEQSGNWSQMLAAGAQLSAQAYWLEGVDTSRDPGLVASSLHFVESRVHAPAQGAMREGGAVRLATTVFAPGGWRSPRPSAAALCDFGTCLPQLQGAVGRLWLPAVDQYVDCSSGLLACYGDVADWTGETEALAPEVDAVGAEQQSAADTPIAAGTPPALQAFAEECSAEGGRPSTESAGLDRLPQNEGGWRCDTPGGQCWDYLTYSGVKYKGGAPGCPEQGLEPEASGPVASDASSVAHDIASLQTSGGSKRGPTGGTWDGTYGLTLNWQCNGQSVPASDIDPDCNALSRQLPSTTLQVSGDNLDTPVGPAGIADDGTTSYTSSVAGLGTGSPGLSAHFAFVRDPNGLVTVSGTYTIVAPVSWSQYTPVYSSGCEQAYQLTGSWPSYCYQQQTATGAITLSASFSGPNANGPSARPSTPTAGPTPAAVTLPAPPTPQTFVVPKPPVKTTTHLPVSAAPAAPRPCHTVSNSPHMLICVPAWLSGSSVGNVTVTNPGGTQVPFNGTLPPGAGLVTGPGASATIDDTNGAPYLSVGPDSDVLSNFLAWVKAGDYQTPPQLITCQDDPAHCDLTTAQELSTAAYKALRKAFSGDVVGALTQLGTGEYRALGHVLNGAARVACFLSSGFVTCDGPDDSAAITVGTSGSEIDVLSGSWVVLDTASGAALTLHDGERVFLPGDHTRAASQNLAAGVGTFDVASFHGWWEGTPSSTVHYVYVGIVSILLAAVVLELLFFDRLHVLLAWLRRRGAPSQARRGSAATRFGRRALDARSAEEPL